MLWFQNNFPALSAPSTSGFTTSSQLFLLLFPVSGALQSCPFLLTHILGAPYVSESHPQQCPSATSTPQPRTCGHRPASCCPHSLYRAHKADPSSVPSIPCQTPPAGSQGPGTVSRLLWVSKEECPGGPGGTSRVHINQMGFDT